VAIDAGQVETSAAALAGLAEDTTARTRDAAAEATENAADVNSISTATESLSESITAVSRQADQGAAVITAAAAAARDADATIATLTDSASHIGQIVNMISNFAHQTNLLALNATIEAARAGEAGRGFAVVAAEVKTLSKAVSEATEDIKRQIGGIQAATLHTADAMRQIRSFVTTIEDIASQITLTMEHHRTATQTIAGSIIRTAGGAHLLSDHIIDASRAAVETGVTASDMQAMARILAERADALRTASEGFLTEVTAA
jgi:methyl-accepting chemotaxis protein